MWILHRVTALPIAATCGGLGAALIVVGVAGAQSAQPTGIELFEAMMPVFTDDRCMNCHGVVDPVTGTEHAGGMVAGFERPPPDIAGSSDTCFACHTEGDTPRVEHRPADEFGHPARDETVHSGLWMLAPSNMSFVGKDAVALCRQVKAMTADRSGHPEVILAHFSQDERIQMAFEGLRGIDARSPEWPVSAEPPPMSNSDFLAAASRWITEGSMGCGSGWNGTITRRHIMTYTRQETLGAGVNDRGGTRTVEQRDDDLTTVTIDEGKGSATRRMTYTSTDSVHHTVGGQCKPGAQLTWGTYDIVDEEERTGSATTAVEITVTLEPAGTYSIGYATPDPDLTVTRSERTSWHVCGANAKAAGLLPGSGPDVDRKTSNTSIVKAGWDLISWSVSGTVDSAAPDTLAGSERDPGGDDNDYWETTWSVTRN